MIDFMHSRTGGVVIHQPHSLLIGYTPPTAEVSRTATGAWVVRGAGPRRRYRTKKLAYREQARREIRLEKRRQAVERAAKRTA